MFVPLLSSELIFAGPMLFVSVVLKSAPYPPVTLKQLLATRSGRAFHVRFQKCSFVVSGIFIDRACTPEE